MAARQIQDSISYEVALALVCRNARDLTILCQALCVSKSTAAAIHSLDHKGTVVMTQAAGTARATAQTQWLFKYGSDQSSSSYKFVHRLDASCAAPPGSDATYQLQVRRAVGAFTGMRELRLSNFIRPGNILAHLVRPQNLVSLEMVWDRTQQAAPPLLEGPIAAAAMSALPNLKHLSITGNRDWEPLPSDWLEAATQLKHLTANVRLHPLPAHLLTSLQRLAILDPPYTSEELAAGRSNLSAISLMYYHTDAAVHSAVWKDLPGLRELHISSGPATQHAAGVGAQGVRSNHALTPAVASGIAAATSLTTLSIRCGVLDQSVDLPRTLAGLTDVRHLSLEFSEIAGYGRGDASAGVLLRRRDRLALRRFLPESLPRIASLNLSLPNASSGAQVGGGSAGYQQLFPSLQLLVVQNMVVTKEDMGVLNGSNIQVLGVLNPVRGLTRLGHGLNAVSMPALRKIAVIECFADSSTIAAQADAASTRAALAAWQAARQSYLHMPQFEVFYAARSSGQQVDVPPGFLVL